MNVFHGRHVSPATISISNQFCVIHMHPVIHILYPCNLYAVSILNPWKFRWNLHSHLGGIADNVHLLPVLGIFNKVQKRSKFDKKWKNPKTKQEVHICNMCRRIPESFVEIYSVIQEELRIMCTFSICWAY